MHFLHVYSLVAVPDPAIPANIASISCGAHALVLGLAFGFLSWSLFARVAGHALHCVSRRFE